MLQISRGPPALPHNTPHRPRAREPPSIPRGAPVRPAGLPARGGQMNPPPPQPRVLGKSPLQLTMNYGVIYMEAKKHYSE